MEPSTTDTTTITLPSGGVVTLMPVGALRAKDKKAVLESVGDPEDGKIAAALSIAEGVAARIIGSWTIPYLPNAPLPRDEPWIIGELRIADYDRLLAETRPAMEILFPRDTPDDAGKPGTPTPPASA